jgi:hypothetical protein
LPENELDELADNFFCDLHVHEHSHDQLHQHDKHEELSESELLNSLNPLSNSVYYKLKPRMSILSNKTIFILNQNHLNAKDLLRWCNEESTIVACSECSSIIGYKSGE